MGAEPIPLASRFSDALEVNLMLPPLAWSRLEAMDLRLRFFVCRLQQLAQAFEDWAVLSLIEQSIKR